MHFVNPTIPHKPIIEIATEHTTDHEIILINRAIRAVSELGVKVGLRTIINFYVALKSKPLAILAGSKGVGKDDFVRCIAKILTDSEANARYQFMTGHPWWAERSEEIAAFHTIHAQFNALKLQMLFEDANHPENIKRIFLACLRKISPAEISGFFTEIARQLFSGRIIHLPEPAFTTPFIYPDNLLVIGTIDAPWFEWYSEDLLTHTSIINWHDRGIAYRFLDGLLSPESDDIDEERVFLSSRIRDEGAAHMKIQRILKDQSEALKPVLEIESVLLKFGAKFSTRQVTREAIIYLSNAWTSIGAGLFDRSHSRNLEIALDFAIAQLVLPRAWSLLQESDRLQTALSAMFDGRFPNTRLFVENIKPV